MNGKYNNILPLVPKHMRHSSVIKMHFQIIATYCLNVSQHSCTNASDDVFKFLSVV